MRNFLFALTLIGSQISFAQQYDSVVIEKEDVDTNNEIYLPGSVFIYDYEISQKGNRCKLATNKGFFASRSFDLVPSDSPNIGIDKIHMIVVPVVETERTNENQTQISFLQDPSFSTFSSTGAVENDKNVWVHPIRIGFFAALETAPFPFVKKPLIIGKKWTDQMQIGQAWGHDEWVTWEGPLLQTYNYEVTGREKIDTRMGVLDCFVIKGTAQSRIGTSRLNAYFSEKYGFVRMEYRLHNDLNITLWLIDHKTGQTFNDSKTFFQTREYIKQ